MSDLGRRNRCGLLKFADDFWEASLIGGRIIILYRKNWRALRTGVIEMYCMKCKGTPLRTTDKNYCSDMGACWLGMMKNKKDLCVLIDYRMTMSHQYDTAMKETNTTPGYSKQAVSSRDRAVLTSLYKHC